MLNRKTLDKLDLEQVIRTVKGELVASTCAYSKQSLSREKGKLGLINMTHIRGIRIDMLHEYFN